jgi:hypothetical protein
MMMMMMMMLLLLQDDDCDYENLSNKLLRFHSRSAPKLRAKTSPSSYQIVEIGERERERERLHALLLLKEHVNSRVKSDEMKWCNFDDFKGKRAA